MSRELERQCLLPVEMFFWPSTNDLRACFSSREKEVQGPSPHQPCCCLSLSPHRSRPSLPDHCLQLRNSANKWPRKGFISCFPPHSISSQLWALLLFMLLQSLHKHSFRQAFDNAAKYNKANTFVIKPIPFFFSLTEMGFFACSARSRWRSPEEVKVGNPLWKIWLSPYW